MKKQKIVCVSTLLWLCCVYSPPTQAQDKSPTPDSLTRYKWEIGTDLLWLIDKNSAPRFSVFARRNFTTKNGKHRAWRLRVGAEYKADEWIEGLTLFGTPVERRYEQNYAVLLRPGYEWQKVFGKFQLNYGVDAHFRWQRQDREVYDRLALVSPEGNFFSNDTFDMQSWEWGLIGFIGAKYFISSRWSVSAESHFSNIYTIYDNLVTYRWVNGVSPGFMFGGGKTDRETFDFALNPLYILQISYHFN